jgi:hypothetical protein
VALRQFLTELSGEGRVRLPEPQPLTPDALAAADDLLGALAERAALELPGSPPPLSLAAARWAAARLYLACQALAYRELSDAEVRQGLSLPCPAPPSASAAWSVDLTLRQLPELAELVRGLPTNDPLREGLQALAQAWPLSSVGVPGLAGLDGLDPVLAHPALRRLYVDRVLLRGDRSRLDDPRVREGARAVLGLHPELCPQLADTLQTKEPA